MEDNKSRIELMELCTSSVVEIMKLHSKKTGTSMHNILMDLVALPVWVTTRLSSDVNAEDNMLLTMSEYRQLIKDYEQQENEYYEKAQLYSSRALH